MNDQARAPATTQQERYIPAMGHRALTPFYDPFVRAVLRERLLRQRLIDRLRLRAGSRVLDVGSGTGTLALMAKQQHPEAQIVGIDGDSEIVDFARRKVDAAGVRVSFHVGLATELPFEDHSFDRVTSMFVMHHLSHAAKERALVEALRVLQPGGEIHIVDIGPPRSRIGRAMSRVIRGIGELADNLDGRLTGMLAAAGFAEVFEEDRVVTAFGPAIFLRGVRSATGRSSRPHATAPI